jgi:hypothetical protein
MTIRVQLQKKNSGREPQGAWCQDELIGGASRKVTLNELTVGQWPAGKNMSMEADDSVGICHLAMTGEDTAD